MQNIDTKTTHKLLASAEEVDMRIAQMAQEIIDEYAQQDPLFVCFLRGAAPFASKLMFSIAQQSAAQGQPFHPVLDYMTISTYGSGREAKDPKIVMDLGPSAIVQGRVVIMLDDVLDTGTTLAFAENYFLQERDAEAVESVVLVEKENDRATYQKGAKVVGFSSPRDQWLTGMGMDDAKELPEANRWLGSILIVNPDESL